MNNAQPHLWKNTAHSHFQKWADHYDRDIINTLLFIPCYRRVLAMFRHWRRRGLSNKRVLDIGCGTGTLAASYLAQLPDVNSITGLDMSNNMIAKAQQKRLNFNLQNRVNFLVGDAENLPFDDNSFDVITCCNSFHHYPHQHVAVAEMNRVLDKAGRALILDGNRDDPFGYFIFEVCVARAEKHVHHCTAQRFRGLLEQAHFQRIDQNSFNVCPPVLINAAYT